MSQYTEFGEEIVQGWADAPVSGDRIDLHQGPIIAGDPEGARVEVTEAGLRAYDSTGTETASLAGEGGEFVGGEFRTSDALPGQVTLSDTAYTHESGLSAPGIGVTPTNPAQMDTMPGIGATSGGIQINGGKRVGGDYAHVSVSPGSAYQRAVGADGAVGETSASPTLSLLRTASADGATARMSAEPGNVSMRVLGTNGLNTARITADDRTITLFSATGGQRYLELDENGIWVRSGGNSYNLEETAQDSGWNSITLASGIVGAGSPAWRNKGGVIYFRGTVTAEWGDGWNTVATGLPDSMTPEVRVIRTSPSTGGANLLFRMDNDGSLQFYRPGGGSVQGDLSGLFYPTG